MFNTLWRSLLASVLVDVVTVDAIFVMFSNVWFKLMLGA